MNGTFEVDIGMCRYMLLQEEDEESARKAVVEKREAAEVDCEKVRLLLLLHAIASVLT